MRDVVAGDPFLEHERTGADLAAGGPPLAYRLFLKSGSLRLAVRQRLRARDAERRQRLADEECRVRRLERHDERRRSGRPRRRTRVLCRAMPPKTVSDSSRSSPARRSDCREVQPAVVVELDGGGVEVGPVLELDAAPELERVGQAVAADASSSRRGRGRCRPTGPGLQRDQAFRRSAEGRTTSSRR